MAIATQGMEGLFIATAWVSGYKVQSSDNGNAYSWVTNVQVGSIYALKLVRV